MLPIWVNQARNHWKEYRPKMYAELKKAGLLEKELQKAAERTQREMSALMRSGAKWHEAWEAVREKYLFLPEEPDENEAEELRKARPDLEIMMKMEEELVKMYQIMGGWYDETTS